MVGLAPVALAGRGESGWSEKGENAEKRELDEGLSPNGALTAIILMNSGGLSTDRRGTAGRDAQVMYRRWRRMPLGVGVVQVFIQARLICNVRAAGWSQSGCCAGAKAGREEGQVGGNWHGTERIFDGQLWLVERRMRKGG